MVSANFGGEPIKGELAEQNKNYREFMRFNGKPRASLGMWGSLFAALDDKRRWGEYFRYHRSASEPTEAS